MKYQPSGPGCFYLFFGILLVCFNLAVGQFPYIGLGENGLSIGTLLIINLLAVVFVIFFASFLSRVAREEDQAATAEKIDWQARYDDYIASAVNCERIANRPDLQGLPNMVEMKQELLRDAAYWREKAQNALDCTGIPFTLQRYLCKE